MIMNRTHFKNKMTDFRMYLKRNTSLIFYIFIAFVVLSYASLYTYKTYIQSETSSIPEEEKYKEIALNNNRIQLVENEYNEESEFYVAKFVVKERDSSAPLIANDTLDVSGIARLNNNDLQELNVESKQISPTFFVVEVDNLPKNQVELRLDFNLDAYNSQKESTTDDASLYTFISEDEMNPNIHSLSDEEYRQESFSYEIDTVSDQIESYEEEIDHYNDRIDTLKDQISEREQEKDLMTETEKTELEISISSQESEIATLQEEINEIEKSIKEREEKLEILKDNL